MQEMPETRFQSLGWEESLELCAYVLSHFSRVQLFATPWTVAHQAPLSMGFSRQEVGGLLCPSPGDLPHPGTEPTPPALESEVLTTGPPGKSLFFKKLYFFLFIKITFS